MVASTGADAARGPAERAWGAAERSLPGMGTNCSFIAQSIGPVTLRPHVEAAAAGPAGHRVAPLTRLYVHPVVLGRGRPLFPSEGTRRGLTLLGSRTFGNGVVLLHYGRQALGRSRQESASMVSSRGR